ncbi:hypothetical protein DL764_002579 [Monosporascus ibericus]|uniref:Uncharacterized protein n=1 Tax=Monosporascus ibericus TaxID=155417 RepID=A0A4Q4TN81_9PEZI|nr:hypothetical protein DL764_002579 [Monosporascus ibericus]
MISSSARSIPAMKRAMSQCLWVKQWITRKLSTARRTSTGARQGYNQQEHNHGAAKFDSSGPELRIVESKEVRVPIPGVRLEVEEFQVGGIPLVEAVRDVELDGWEDEWFANGRFEVESWGPLEEPKMDFVYKWVNGLDEAFKKIRHQYELTQLNDDAGKWISRHGTNRYRDWGELLYSLRSLDRHAAGFISKIQILINSVAAKPDGTGELRPQRSSWLHEDPETDENVLVLNQEAFFREEEQPAIVWGLTFFGTQDLTTRDRGGLMRKAMASFPGPAARGACDRFRGESHHYQIYPCI